MHQWLIILQILAAVVSQNATNESARNLTCPTCRCYAVDCSVLANPDIDCMETYTDTCESADYVVDDDDCAVICDCCIQGQCMSWSAYDCIIYRAYQVLSVVYFIILLVGYFMMQGLHKHFFSVFRLWPVNQKSVDWENDPKVLNIRFKQRVAVEYKHEFDRKISGHKGFYRAKDLFEEIGSIRYLAIRNMIFFGGVAASFAGMAGLTTFIIFGITTSPRIFSYVFWQLNFCGLTFLVMSTIGFFQISVYGKQVLQLILHFEKTHKCRIQVLSKLKVFQFRFRKDKLLVPKNPQESAGSFADLDVTRRLPTDFNEDEDSPSGFLLD